MSTAPIFLPGARLVACSGGVLVWPEREVLVVADLHLEKGSSLARGGRYVPPYDTRATLARLAQALRLHRPRTVVSLGDGFHDPAASGRLQPEDAATLRAMTAAHSWYWVAGNHDPGPPAGLGGAGVPWLEIGNAVFRHEPDGPLAEAAEIAGHLHPKAVVRRAGRRIARRCFATDGRRLILPAFGAYTGGLNVLDPALAGRLRRRFWAYLLGERRVHVIPGDRLDADGVQLAFDPTALRPGTAPVARRPIKGP